MMLEKYISFYIFFNVFNVIINLAGNVRLQRLVLTVRLAIVPSSHGGFFREV
jgi:hypothetical protein